jgi:glycerol-3-phosphate dehydrogenase
MRNLHAVIIGGGGTGAALAYDLALRGFRVSLFERGELTSGTTGRHHGQLHSGARYAVKDPNIARECWEETLILRKIAPETLEFNGGLFVAVEEEETAYLEPFLEGCAAAGIPAKIISPSEARRIEPGLSSRVRTAVEVPDGTIDAFRLAMSFFASAQKEGARIFPYHEVLGVETKNGAVTGVRVRNHAARGELLVRADVVVNAGGAWAGRIAKSAGVRLEVTPSPGTLLAVAGRLTDRVISRLAPPGNGDILLPQRRLTIIGTTEWIASDIEDSRCREEDLPFLTRRAAELVPAFSEASFHAAWSAPRPLFGGAAGGETAGGDEDDGRGLSRDFACVDHGSEGAANFFSLVGGKATVLRAMAEKAADLVCRGVEVETFCETAKHRLSSWRDYYRGL